MPEQKFGSMKVDIELPMALSLQWILFGILLWSCVKVTKVYSFGSPQGATIYGLPTAFGKWLTGKFYFFSVRRMITQAYHQANGGIFAMPTDCGYDICLSKPEAIEEFNNAPIKQLSLIETASERLHPDVFYGGTPLGSFDGHLNLSQGTLKNRLRSNMPLLRLDLENSIHKAIGTEIRGGKRRKDCQGWIAISPLQALSNVFAKANSLMIVGPALADNPSFVQNYLRYLRDATIVEEILHFLPTVLVKPLGHLAMRWSGSLRALDEMVSDLVQDRLCESEKGNRTACDLTQWTIDLSRNGTPFSMTRQVLSMLFGAAHQMPLLVTFALYNLCVHPEYIDPLRKEALVALDQVYDNRNEDSPLLDSFLKETARLNPITFVALQHKVMYPFTFSDGTHVPAGNKICIASHPIMRDAANYEDPSSFHGFRFADRTGPVDQSITRLSYPSPLFPFWGIVKRACPARFYVSMMTKMVLSHIILNYDMKLRDKTVPSNLDWGIFSVPHPRLTVLLRKRGDFVGSGRC